MRRARVNMRVNRPPAARSAGGGPTVARAGAPARRRTAARARGRRSRTTRPTRTTRGRQRATESAVCVFTSRFPCAFVDVHPIRTGPRKMRRIQNYAGSLGQSPLRSFVSGPSRPDCRHTPRQLGSLDAGAAAIPNDSLQNHASARGNRHSPIPQHPHYRLPVKRHRGYR